MRVILVYWGIYEVLHPPVRFGYSHSHTICIILVYSHSHTRIREDWVFTQSYHIYYCHCVFTKSYTYLLGLGIHTVIPHILSPCIHTVIHVVTLIGIHILERVQVFTLSYMSILFINVCPRGHTHISISLWIHKVPPMYLNSPSHTYAHPCGKLMILSTHTCTH